MSQTPDKNPPDCVPEEFPDLGERNITIELDPRCCLLIQAAAMHVSMSHAFHGCQKEEVADELLFKLNEAISAQIKGL